MSPVSPYSSQGFGTSRGSSPSACIPQGLNAVCYPTSSNFLPCPLPNFCHSPCHPTPSLSVVKMVFFHRSLKTRKLSLAKWRWWRSSSVITCSFSSLPAVITEPGSPDLGTPFTSRLPPELQVLKDQQVHHLAPKVNRSRILRQACKRMAEEAKQKVCGTEGMGNMTRLATGEVGEGRLRKDHK